LYTPDTILKLREPRTVGSPGAADYQPFAYDRVRVIGQSPVDHGLRSAAWAGANGQGVIIEPLGAFASNVDEPFGKLQRLYEVESIPTQEAPVVGTVEIVSSEARGPSPEDVFASQAPGEDDGRAARLKPAPVLSPLDGEEQGAVIEGTGPLGPLEAGDVPLAPETGDESPLDWEGGP
jgi:hypothetical protein